MKNCEVSIKSAGLLRHIVLLVCPVRRERVVPFLADNHII